jgi:prepilin-type N-terminal cleavage/methylation domain-containing protein
MNRRGFTLIEVVIVIVIIGVMAVFFFPRLGATLQKQNVRSARNAITTLHAKARAIAIQRGREVRFVLDANRIYLASRHPVTGVVDTVDSPQNLSDRYGVSISSTRDTLRIDPRGVGMASSNTVIVVSRAGFADTITISSIGSVLR